jgi:hypothetical protein
MDKPSIIAGRDGIAGGDFLVGKRNPGIAE